MIIQVTGYLGIVIKQAPDTLLFGTSFRKLSEQELQTMID